MTNDIPRTRHNSLSELLKAQAQATPDALAILAPGRAPLTYERLYDQMLWTAESLAGAGVGPRDRVALMMPNGPEMAVATLATASCAVCAPLNTQFGEDELDFHLRDSKARALVVQPDINPFAAERARALGIKVIELLPEPHEEAGVFRLAAGRRAGGGAARSTPSGDSVALLIYTSGTTSRPKAVPLTHTNLLISAENIARTLALATRDRCLNVMPLHHTHGLVGAVLASLSSGGSVACAPGFYAPSFFEWVREFHPTWYTAAPSMHQSILARAAAQGGVPESPLRLVRSASSPLAPSLMLDLESAFGVPVIEAYAMTEALQITSNPLPPGRRKPGTVGPAQGVEVAVVDALGNFLSQGQSGEVVIRGENVFRGYENNPEANAASFLGGWFRTGDLGSLDFDGYLTISGRIKEFINRAGEKISPREIEEVLLAHHAVEQAVCFPLPDVSLGEDIGAAVVLREGVPASDVTEFELREFASARLAFFKVPRRVKFLADILKGASGKIRRNAMAQQLGMTGACSTPGAAAFVPPRTPTEATLAEVWAEVLGVARVGLYDDFISLGGNSLLATKVVTRVADRVGVELSLLDFFEAPTVARLASVVSVRQAERLDDEEMLALLAELEGLTEEEALRLSEEEVVAGGGAFA